MYGIIESLYVALHKEFRAEIQAESKALRGELKSTIGRIPKHFGLCCGNQGIAL